MNGISKRIHGARLGGFSLIEVLIAVVVLATGLLALTALQGALMRNSADAKARSQLAAYAQSLMDDARQQGYGAIQTGSGAALLSTSTGNSLADAARAMGVSELTETSTISEVVNGTSTYKIVKLQLNWRDVTGTPRNLQLNSVVSPLLLAQNNLNELEPPDATGGYRPIVRRPSPVTEGMIPIAIGNGQDTSATNPKPEFAGKKNDTLVADTRFEVLTYNPGDNLGNSNFARFDKRIETAVVGCTCQFGNGGFPTSGPDAAVNTFLSAIRFEPSYWQGERYSEPRQVSNSANPTSPADVSQSVLCDVCCRDHKDTDVGATALYKPWPKVNETAHGHYRLASNGQFELATSGEYMESCRVVRTNGIWRVTPDPRLDDLALVPTQVYVETSPLPPANTSAAQSALLANEGKSAYVDYMFNFIQQRFFAGQSRNDNYDDSTRYSMQATAGLNKPDYVPITGSSDKRWLHSRGVLVDYLLPEAQDRLQKAVDACEGTGTIAQAQCILPYLPFATVNVTELARWSASDTSGTGIVPQFDTAATPTNYGQTRMRRHSSGVALFPAVSPDDDVLRLLDEQVIALVSGSRTGVWANISDTNGVVFGNPHNPTRGAITVSGGSRFNVSWNGVTAASNNLKADDPLLVVVPIHNDLSSEVACNGNTAKNSSNPYSCSTDTGSNVMLGLAQFNRKDQPTQNQNTNPCNSANTAPKVPKQATCIAHTLTGVVVDGTNYSPAAVNYTLVSGTSGRTSEKRTLVLSNVRMPPNPASAVTLNFSSATTNATAVCESTTFVEWTCH